MESEAHKLISLSLSKIAASRSQRGGLNLRKSLFLTHVLQQAKNVYVQENYESLMAVKKKQVKTVKTEVIIRKPSVEVAVAEPKIQNAPNFIEDIDRQLERTLPIECNNAINMKEIPETSDSGSQVDEDPINDSLADPRTFDKENHRPNEPLDFSTRTADSNVDYCARSSKRKLEEITANSETKVEDVYSPLKKLKDCDTSNDSSQISTLIHRFNAGFSGLVHSCPTTLADNNNPQSCRFSLGNIAAHAIALAV